MERFIAKSILFITYATLIGILGWAMIITWDTSGIWTLAPLGVFVFAFTIAWACRVLDRPRETIETKRDMTTSEFIGNTDATPEDRKIIIKSPTKPIKKDESNL